MININFTISELKDLYLLTADKPDLSDQFCDCLIEAFTLPSTSETERLTIVDVLDEETELAKLFFSDYLPSSIVVERSVFESLLERVLEKQQVELLQVLVNRIKPASPSEAIEVIVTQLGYILKNHNYESGLAADVANQIAFCVNALESVFDDSQRTDVPGEDLEEEFYIYGNE